MTRFRARTVAVLLTGVIACMCTGVSAAGAATASPDASWAGNYDMYVTWTGHPTGLFSLTLNGNHTGSDGFGDVVTWKKTLRNITITISADGSSATYLGTKTRNGFNTKKKQGTSSSSGGNTGTWYALL